jgi:flagellar protein FliO/FliZ
MIIGGASIVTALGALIGVLALIAIASRLIRVGGWAPRKCHDGGWVLRKFIGGGAPGKFDDGDWARRLIDGFGWVQRLLQGVGSGAQSQPEKRLALRETVALDPRRRLHLVQCGERQVVLLTGGTQDIVVGWIDDA